MRNRFVLLAIFILAALSCHAQHIHELGLRLGPSVALQSSNSTIDPSNFNIRDNVTSTNLEADLCYSISRDSGSFVRASIGYLISHRTQANELVVGNSGYFDEKVEKVRLSIGLGHSFSTKVVTIRLGLECLLAWQPHYSSENHGDFMDNQGNSQTQVVTVKYPGEGSSSLQFFSSIYMRVGKRVSLGVEFRQPFTLIFIRGDKTIEESHFDANDHLLTSVNSTENINETRFQTSLVLSPLIGIRIKL